LKKLFLLNKR